MAIKETLISWLRDAHAMEVHALEMMERQSERLGEYPALQGRIREHIKETQEQERSIRECLKLLGSDSSSIKSGIASVAGNMQAFMTAMASDEPVKGAMASYAFEHFEIASYKVLIAAAEELNEPQIVHACTDILHQEEQMQKWLADYLPELTEQFLQHETAGAHG